MKNVSTTPNDPEIALLHTLRQDVPPVHPSTLNRARHDLLALATHGQVNGARSAKRQSSRGLAPMKRAVVRMTAVGAALMIGGVGVQVGTAGSIGSSAEAASVLNEGADAIIASDAKIRPDQYTKYRTEYTTNGKQDDAWKEVWVPADPSKPWVIHKKMAGDQTVVAVAAVNGEFNGPEGSKDFKKKALAKGYWPENSAPFFAALPRDPERFLPVLENAARYLNDADKGEKIADGGAVADNAFFWLARTLGDTTVPAPADLRSALFRVAAEIPGVTVERNTRVNGRPAVTFGRTSTWNGIPFERRTISFDSANGQVISTSLTMTGAAGALSDKLGGSKREDTTSLTTTTVVDSAPTDGKAPIPCTAFAQSEPVCSGV
jgi:hypothetical protein